MRRQSGDFITGDVYVELKGPRIYSYILQSRMLSLNSPWFKASLEKPTFEYDCEVAEEVTKKTGIAHVYDMGFDSEKGLWLLTKKVCLFNIVIM